MPLLTTLTTHWSAITTTYPPGAIEITVAILSQLLGFWLISTLYLLLDLLYPSFSQTHKLQSSRSQPSRTAILLCFRTVATANLSSTLLHLVLLHFTNYKLTLFTIPSHLPTMREILSDFLYALVTREALFYTIHRALHHPLLYRHIHKQHHSFTTPMALAAQYAHPVEHLLANVMPIVLPLALRRAHILSFALFLTAMLLETASVHSGYDFAGARRHDLHHEKFRVNYGASVGVLDWLFGTDVVGWDRKGKGKGEEKKEE
ncbi:hypothetical protein AJ79_07064 [Helicocarpus griseus UAMH5409]|uniref:Fatty acid hydroxylase domain-containing protein n=1 Tax=Helicocarpus griseus UAMH5409 TaxID=1447875 RepID=A0A2B7X7A1_9EURO|nr:hypothetical protein AJ79_07064 [Helicocarpus griseus UAMH5409]